MSRSKHKYYDTLSVVIIIIICYKYYYYYYCRVVITTLFDDVNVLVFVSAGRKSQ